MPPSPPSVWERRTNRLIAAAVIVIGLTMMVSNITQCIYIGMLFIVVALVWLTIMTLQERKAEPPRPRSEYPSPVLFLVTTQVLPRGTNRPTPSQAQDKPPSYEQVLGLEGSLPDYSTLEIPPRYEDLPDIYDHPGSSSSGVSANRNAATSQVSSTGTGCPENLTIEKDTGSRCTGRGSLGRSKGVSLVTKQERLRHKSTGSSTVSDTSIIAFSSCDDGSRKPPANFSVPVHHTNKCSSTTISRTDSKANSDCSDSKRTPLLRLRVPTLTDDTADHDSSFLDVVTSDCIDDVFTELNRCNNTAGATKDNECPLAKVVPPCQPGSGCDRSTKTTGDEPRPSV